MCSRGSFSSLLEDRVSCGECLYDMKLQASLGGSYAAMSSSDKAWGMSYGFESLLALVKVHIMDIWEERKSGDIACAQQPCPHSPTGDLGDIPGVNGQNSKGM